jgi:hypothetical protein
LVKELDQAAQVNVHWKKVGQAAQVTDNKVLILASEAGKIRKSYKEKKATICLKQSSKRRHILFYSENDYSIEKSKFKIISVYGFLYSSSVIFQLQKKMFCRMLTVYHCTCTVQREHIGNSVCFTKF